MTTFGGTSGGNVTISSVISGAGGFTKSNAGTLTLSNFTNTYTGGTVLNAGEVAFPAGSGTATPHFGTGPLTVNSEATLHTNRSFFNNSVTLNSATVVTGNSFESLLAGPVTLNGITTFSFGTTGGFRITGNISGTGGFTTTGTTQWTLTGTNSYTGPTTIQAGTLRYSAAAAVGPGAISIATGGKANLNYTGTRSIASLTLGGVLQPAGTYGSNASSAANKSDTYFTSTGVGVLNVLLIPTTTAVTSNLTPAMTGNAVTFTATVTGGTPTGNVTFFDGPTAIGTSPLNASFQATLTRSTLTAGTHTITAQYLGDPSHATSTSAGFTQVLILSAFDTWATSQSLTLGVNAGPLDDPNHDGLCNLLAFALGASPTTSSVAALPKLTRTGNTWTFEYDRNDLSLGVTTQIVEYGSNLTGWTPITIPATTSGSVTITPGVPSDHVTVTIPMSGGSCFVRLKVMQ
ncbi:MAG: Ig-like domain repeat protein, partial [Verrucomicrobiaceae bacterium]|nr:Ig-like domain repeat protein [Verrucomicrobiaceae bacterium]